MKFKRLKQVKPGGYDVKRRYASIPHDAGSIRVASSISKPSNVYIAKGSDMVWVSREEAAEIAILFRSFAETGELPEQIDNGIVLFSEEVYVVRREDAGDSHRVLAITRGLEGAKSAAKQSVDEEDEGLQQWRATPMSMALRETWTTETTGASEAYLEIQRFRVEE